GPGDQPPAPPKDSASGTSGKPGRPGGKPSGGGASAEMKTLADVLDYFKKNGFQEPEPDGNEGFSDEMKEKVHILFNPEAEEPFCFFLAPNLGTANQSACFGNDKGGDRLRGVRGFGGYGVLEYESSKQYLPLDFLAGKKGVKAAGIYGKGGMSEVKDIGVALDMLATYENFSEADLNGIGKRLNKHAEGPYLITSHKAEKTVLIRNVTEKTTYRVWPAESVEKGDNVGYEDRKGPGTAVDLSFGPDAPFQPEPAFDATQNMALQKTSADGGTALYLLNDAADGTKKWFVMVRASIDKTPSRSRHVQIFGAGKDWNALPEVYTLTGYASSEVPRTAKLGLVLGEGRGALCLYRFAIPAKDGSNVKDKKGNSVGPILAWGKGDHVEVCRAGKF
ncbi:MAG: hypothetical protein AAB262_15945, partial [Elusimicrobiota bacterium]